MFKKNPKGKFFPTMRGNIIVLSSSLEHPLFHL